MTTTTTRNDLPVVYHPYIISYVYLVGTAPSSSGDNISVSNPFDDPVGPPPRVPYQQQSTTPFPPVTRPQGTHLSLMNICILKWYRICFLSTPCCCCAGPTRPFHFLVYGFHVGGSSARRTIYRPVDWRFLLFGWLSFAPPLPQTYLASSFVV